MLWSFFSIGHAEGEHDGASVVVKQALWVE